MIEIYRARSYEDIIRRAIKGVFYYFNIELEEVEIEIDFLEKEEMQELNRESRSIDEVTDVLSFPMNKIVLPFLKDDYKEDINPETGAVILGEIYICEERAKEQAIEYNHSVAREISFLVIHGMLHILGFDHINEQERMEMEQIQEQIMKNIGATREISDKQYSELGKNDSTREISDKQYSELKKNDSTREISDKQDSELEKNNTTIIKTEKTNLFKCGFVAVIGRPNAGKSTLINYIVGQKVAIVSWKPQTTRNKILGIRNDNDSQIVFVDTPGLHTPVNELGKFMMRSVTAALNEVDVILYLINAEKDFNNYDQENVKRYVEWGKKVILLVNKIDRVDAAKVGQILSTISKVEGLSAVVPISALRGKNIKPLLEEIKKVMPAGEAIFPEDMYTDRSMNFIVSEVIREKALRLLDEEIPYGIAVKLNKYNQREDGLIEIDADIIIQKDSHKGIVLGKAGAMIKKISTYARQDIEQITGAQVFLSLWVRVEKDWREKENLLEKLGYNKLDYKG